MKKHRHMIKEIITGSIAEELGLETGDELLLVNGKQIEDVLDYRFETEDEEIVLLIRKKDGEEWELEIEKEYAEELGIRFEDGLMDEYHSCRNQCIFCFIDQMPKGMRDSLYFKDDDTRLSFLQGNYVTLTNLSEQEIERICFYKLSPINLSVHTTNPELRCKMLNNRFAGKLLDNIRKLVDSGIEINAQVVLCRGYNDGKELDRTIADLEPFIPQIKSLSVVPAGLTKFREGLPKLVQFSSEESKAVIHQVELWQQHMLYAHGTRFVYASDEWYIKAKQALPEGEAYEEYPQLENGVGMMRLLFDETLQELEQYRQQISHLTERRSISIATGVLAAPYIEELSEKIMEVQTNLSVTVFTIINHFFGEEITVAGLLTGKDLIEQLKDKPLGEELLLPEELLRSGEDILLDDIKVSDLEKALQTRIRIVQSTGSSFLSAVTGRDKK